MKFNKLTFILPILFLSAALAFGAVSTNKYTGDPWLDATGGPDIYGYKWADSNEDSVSYNWIDITTIGTQVTGLGDDNYVGPFDIGFDFNYYWYTIDQIIIGSNGYLKVPPGYNISQTFPATIPLGAVPNDFIAAYVMDLNYAAGGECYYYTNYSDQFIVSFINVPCWITGGGEGSHTFQAILEGSDNTITVNYGFQEGLTSNNDILIGIENNNGQVGLLHSFDTYMPSDFTVKYYRPDTTAYEVHDLAVSAVMNDESQAMFLENGDEYIPVAWVKNVGNQIENSTPVRCQISNAGGTVVYEEIIGTATLNPGETEELTYSASWTASTDGPYSISIAHNMGGDMNTANNSLAAEIEVVTLPGELLYDDDGSDDQWSWMGGDGGMGMKFVPPAYPAEITLIRYYIVGVGTPASFIARIYDDDDPGGMPNTMLFDQVVNLGTANQWYSATVSGVVIPDGAFYVSWEMMGDGSSIIGLDSTPPISRNAMEFTGVWAGFRNSETRDVMIRAMVGQGEIPYPVIETSVDTLEFPTTFVGDSAWLDLTISNIGTFGDLIIESIAFPLVPLNLVYNTEGFTPGMTIGPESNETITIRFTPPTPTTWQSNMTINSNASNGTAFVFCIGEGALSVGDNPEGAPVTFNLYQNVPNPFNPVTYIEYSIPAAGNVELVVYNSLGEEITKLVNGEVNAGYHKVAFDGSNLGSGIYFYRISANGFTEMKKMVLMK